jgi:amino acid transporter
LRDEIRRLHSRLVPALVGIGLLIGAAVLAASAGPDTRMLGPAPLSVWLLAVAGGAAIALSFRRS